MQGFIDNLYNTDFKAGLFERIIEQLIKSSCEMKAECIKKDNLLYNHEDKITNRLVEYYLNNKPSLVRFILQSPEKYLQEEDRYKGRTDIRVVSLNWFNDSKDYYTIECKRLDGKSHLNKEYITNGVTRFVVWPPQYPSQDKRNIMFGYIVREIDIPENTQKIAALQKKVLVNVTPGDFFLESSVGSDHFVYSCEYQSEMERIKLSHIFYNFADVMCS